MPKHRHQIYREQIIPQPIDTVFAFFADARNLELITPPFLHFRIRSPRPIEIRPGARIDYQLRLFGVPIRWQTIIEELDPGLRFVDSQANGPYKLWRHLHTFREVPAGTLMADSVEYEIGWSFVGEIAGTLFVQWTLKRIFDYRREKVAELLGVGLEAELPGTGGLPRPVSELQSVLPSERSNAAHAK